MLCHPLSLSWALCFLLNYKRHVKGNIKFVMYLCINEWHRLFLEVSRESMSTWWRRGKWWRKTVNEDILCHFAIFSKGWPCHMFVWMALSDLGYYNAASRLCLRDWRCGRYKRKGEIMHDIVVSQSTAYIYKISARGKVLCWATNSFSKVYNQVER